MPRTVIAVYRFAIGDEVSTADVDAITTDAFAMLDDAKVRDDQGHERSIEVSELTANVVVGEVA